MSVENQVVQVFSIQGQPSIKPKPINQQTAPPSLQSSINHMIAQDIADTKQVELELSNGKKQQPKPVDLVPNLQLDVEILQITKPATIVSQPQLKKHQALDNSVSGHEVKVDLPNIKQTVYFWEILTRNAKRRLLIFNGYLYCLQPQDFGYFVVAIWNLNELAMVKLWEKEGRMKLIFKDDTGKITKEKEFKPVNMNEIRDHLRKELLRMGRLVA